MARGRKPSPKPSSSFNAGPKPAASKAPRAVPGDRNYDGKKSKRPQATGGKSSSKLSSSGNTKRFHPYSCNTCGQIGHKKTKSPFKKLKSQRDVRGSQSGRTDRTQPEVFEYQNTPPPPPPPSPSLAAKEQPSQNVAFTPQSHADLTSYHRSGGDGSSKTIVEPSGLNFCDGLVN